MKKDGQRVDSRAAWKVALLAVPLGTWEQKRVDLKDGEWAVMLVVYLGFSKAVMKDEMLVGPRAAKLAGAMVGSLAWMLVGVWVATMVGWKVAMLVVYLAAS